MMTACMNFIDQGGHMQRPIPTNVHGILDYLTAPTLLVLPRALGLGKKVTNLLTGAGLGVLGYSIMTRYELGLVKLLPMPGHLALDFMSGSMLAAAPFVLLDEQERSGIETGLLIGFGVFEIAASLLTQTQPKAEQAPLGQAITGQIEHLRDLAMPSKAAS
jgi:hypothetical protein